MPGKAPEVVILPEQVAPKAAEVVILPVPAAPTIAAMTKRKMIQAVAEADQPARSLRVKTR